MNSLDALGIKEKEIHLEWDSSGAAATFAKLSIADCLKIHLRYYLLHFSKFYEQNLKQTQEK